jgi:hypothetical protein
MFGNEILEEGEFLTPFQASIKPKIHLDHVNSNNKYTIMMYDIDAPFPDDPSFSPILHWLVTNVSMNKPNGKTIVSYHGPNPPKSSDPHRYTIELLEETNNSYSDNNLPEDKITKNFNIVGFIEKNKLKRKDQIVFQSSFS